MTNDTTTVNHRIHVLGRKEDLDATRVQGKVAIVLDVLFATSTIVTALAHGASAVTPAPDEAAARAEGDRHPPGAVVLAGELYAETLPGFAPPTLERCRVGRIMLARGLAHEIAYAAALSRHDVVPRLEAGRLVQARA